MRQITEAFSPLSDRVKKFSNGAVELACNSVRLFIYILDGSHGEQPSQRSSGDGIAIITGKNLQ